MDNTRIEIVSDILKHYAQKDAEALNELIRQVFNRDKPLQIKECNMQIGEEWYGSYGCPSCDNGCVGDIGTPFCFECGQRLKWDGYND